MVQKRKRKASRGPKVLLDAALVWEHTTAAPVKRNDIVAGTEFLSVFINGEIAPIPRKRGFRRGYQVQDNVAAESRQSEASIYRISRAPSSPRPTITRPSHREIGARLYPISHKSLEHNRQSFTPIVGDIGTTEEIGLKLKAPTPATGDSHYHHNHHHQMMRLNGTRALSDGKTVNRKIIGVSVTSTVEATPYKVRVEHYDNDQLSMVTRSPTELPLQETFSTARTTKSTSTLGISSTPFTYTKSLSTPVTRGSTATTPPARLVTEELSNIVSESNRSGFSVDEGLPRTSWQARSSVTQGVGSTIPHPTPSSTSPKVELDSMSVGSSSEPVEQSYELPEENPEPPENHEEPREVGDNPPQGRKAGRHYDTSLYNQPPKVYPQPSKIYGKPSRVYSEPSKVYGEPEKRYGEPAQIYSEPSKVYSEPAKIYSEPSKVYSEPAKIYGEPEKVYSEPAKIYSEPARIYGEPAKVYGEPAKIYSEPAKVYGSDGQPVEPDEQNYEVDEAVSVGSNGNVHGVVTEASNAPTDVDGHKVGYVVEGRNYRKYRVEERTPDGFIVGEYGVVSHDDGSLRGVRYTADGTINPRLIYDALMKFLAL
uniref:Sgs4 protein n=1 Tax=Fopius arisanus TaxID=64838 RepID=A0A0C9RWR7_9HYME